MITDRGGAPVDDRGPSDVGVKETSLADALVRVGTRAGKRVVAYTGKDAENILASETGCKELTVAYDGAAKAADAAWMQAAGRKGIPTTFVVDSKGLVRWVGHDPASARRAVEVVLHE